MNQGEYFNRDQNNFNSENNNNLVNGQSMVNNSDLTDVVSQGIGVEKNMNINQTQVYDANVYQQQTASSLYTQQLNNVDMNKSVNGEEVSLINNQNNNSNESQSAQITDIDMGENGIKIGSKRNNLFFTIGGMAIVLVIVVVGVVWFINNKDEDKAIYSDDEEQLDVAPVDFISIETVEDYEKLLNGTYDLSKNYILMNDLDLKDYCIDNKCKPIGLDTEDGFSGIFDGNNHTISNYSFTVDSVELENVGFFSELNMATVKNFKLDNAEIIISVFRTYGSYLGLLGGTVVNSLIENCEVNGNIKTNGTIDTGIGSVGLLIGYLDGYKQNSDIKDVLLENYYVDYHLVSLVKDSKATGTITLSTNDKITQVGGLIGKTTASDYGEVPMYNMIEKNIANVDIKVVSAKNDISDIGGFIGSSDTDYIYQCSSFGDIDAYEGLGVGGFIGRTSNSKIEQCYSVGNVKGGYNVAGFISGFNTSTGIALLGVYDSYSTGDVFVATEKTFIIPSNSAQSCDCASFIAEANDMVETSYSTGDIIYLGSDVNYGKPFINSARMTLESTYYNGDILDFYDEEYKYVKLSSEDMLKKSSYSSFDFDEVWSIDEGVSTPYLKWQSSN